MLPKRARPSRLKKLWPGLRRTVAVALGLTACAGAAGGSFVGLARAKALAIRSIEVEGVSTDRAEEIRALLNVKPGDNLLFADLASARQRAESHPWVASAVVKRELPDVLRLVVPRRSPP